MTEALMNQPWWVIDILPEQVPEHSAGQYFAVEAYYLRQPAIRDLRRRFTDILLKLNCYYDFLVFFSDADEYVRNPAPEQLADGIAAGKDLRIILSGEDALITLNHDDTYMTAFHPSGTLLARLGSLASGNGLFLWQPPLGKQGEEEGK